MLHLDLKWRPPRNAIRSIGSPAVRCRSRRGLPRSEPPLEFLVDLADWKRFGLEWSTPAQHEGVLVMMRISHRFEIPLIPGDPADVFRWSSSTP